MNRIIYALIGLLVIYACEDQLHVNPITEKEADNFYKTEAQIEEAVNGVYASLQFTGLYNLYIPVLGEIPSDNTFDEVPANDGGRYGQLDEFSTITSNEVISGAWRDSYIGIQRANTVLNRIDDVDFADGARQAARRGEMKFIRALLYFNLVRVYGDVPLVTEETTDPSAYFGQGRTATSEIYVQIVDDLSAAIQELPGTASQPGKVIRTAAQALLAKVQLTRGDYSGAKKLLEDVVSAGIHGLVGHPKDVFDISNENNEEVIFAVQFASGINGNSEGSEAFRQFSPSGTVNGAKGHNLPTRSLYALFAEDDLRKEAYVGSTAEGVPFSRKYQAPTTSPEDGPSDWVVLRYADVLLMLAEAENELGNTTEALASLNQIRARAGLPDVRHTDPAMVSEAIELERRFELVGEGHRWFDLLRTGKAIRTMNRWFAEQGMNASIDENDLLQPIPQNQIDTDPALSQNPGY